VSPDDDDDQENHRAFAPIHTQSLSLQLSSVTIQVPPQSNQMQSPCPLLTIQIPRQVAPVRQQEQESSPQAEEAEPAHFSSGAKSSRSSLELVTPVSIYLLSIFSDPNLTSSSILDHI
jgi:hypothetical protein